jgi:hypothetical protein
MGKAAFYLEGMGSNPKAAFYMKVLPESTLV